MMMITKHSLPTATTSNQLHIFLQPHQLHLHTPPHTKPPTKSIASTTTQQSSKTASMKSACKHYSLHPTPPHTFVPSHDTSRFYSLFPQSRSRFVKRFTLVHHSPHSQHSTRSPHRILDPLHSTSSTYRAYMMGSYLSAREIGNPRVNLVFLGLLKSHATSSVGDTTCESYPSISFASCCTCSLLMPSSGGIDGSDAF